ncbi:unnamed protein product [marine sediment metagenome]|uniref:CARDB domain-containing protein n=1 Tax=marine sediment metagenome TaxID=412755 RepID=X0VW35_9ZZZZ
MMNYIQKKMNKKIISIFVCLLFLVGMIPITVGMNNYADELELEVNDEQTSPILKIELAHSIWRTDANIHNIGDGDATDVNSSIVFDGIFLGLGTRGISGQIPIIPAGGYETVHSGLMFGIGRTTITISAECVEGSSDELVLQGRFAGIFLIIY